MSTPRSAPTPAGRQRVHGRGAGAAAGREEGEEEAGRRGAQELGGDVERGAEEGDAARDGEAQRDGRVDVAAGDVWSPAETITATTSVCASATAVRDTTESAPPPPSFAAMVDHHAMHDVQ
jgi:hypothetical protein